MSLHVVSVPGPGNHPPTGAGLHLGPKTSLEAVRVLGDSRRAFWVLVLSSCLLEAPLADVARFRNPVITSNDLHMCTNICTWAKTSEKKCARNSKLSSPPPFPPSLISGIQRMVQPKLRVSALISSAHLMPTHRCHRDRPPRAVWRFVRLVEIDSLHRRVASLPRGADDPVCANLLHLGAEMRAPYA